jgi:hypothetical protein
MGTHDANFTTYTLHSLESKLDCLMQSLNDSCHSLRRHLTDAIQRVDDFQQSAQQSINALSNEVKNGIRTLQCQSSHPAPLQKSSHFSPNLDARHTETTDARQTFSQLNIHTNVTPPVSQVHATYAKAVADAPPALLTSSSSTATRTETSQKQTSQSKSDTSRRRPRRNSGETVAKRTRFESRPATLCFFSDSMFKVFIEDEKSERFLFERNFEQNIRFFRGALAMDVFKKSESILRTWLEQDVHSVIISVGTNDISNMSYSRTPHEDVAHTIVSTVLKFNELCKSRNANLVFVMPSPSHKVSMSAYTEVTNSIKSSLAAEQISVICPFNNTGMYLLSFILSVYFPIICRTVCFIFCTCRLETALYF